MNRTAPLRSGSSGGFKKVVPVRPRFSSAGFRALASKPDRRSPIVEGSRRSSAGIPSRELAGRTPTRRGSVGVRDHSSSWPFPRWCMIVGRQTRERCHRRLPPIPTFANFRLVMWKRVEILDPVIGANRCRRRFGFKSTNSWGARPMEIDALEAIGCSIACHLTTRASDRLASAS